MITKAFAEKFAKEWIEAWNAHDLELVLSHYSEDFVMSSPYIVRIAGVDSGTLKGKDDIRAYWAAALEKMPTLTFELVKVLTGVDSVTIYYRGVRGMAAEVFFIGADHLVHRASAHYE